MHEDQLLEQDHVDCENDKREHVGDVVETKDHIHYRKDDLNEEQQNRENVEVFESLEQHVEEEGYEHVDQRNGHKVVSRFFNGKTVVDFVVHHNDAVEDVDEDQNSRRLECLEKIPNANVDVDFIGRFILIDLPVLLCHRAPVAEE